jgi:hypothetical protein
VGAVVVVASAVLVIFALPARRKNLPDAAGGWFCAEATDRRRSR